MLIVTLCLLRPGHTCTINHHSRDLVLSYSQVCVNGSAAQRRHFGCPHLILQLPSSHFVCFSARGRDGGLVVVETHEWMLRHKTEARLEQCMCFLFPCSGVLKCGEKAGPYLSKS